MISGQHWWLRCHELAQAHSNAAHLQPETDWYSVADGALGLASADVPLRQRFADIYGDCRISAPEDSRPTVHCKVTRLCGDSPLVAAEFQDAEPLDAVAFNISVLPDRRLVEVTSSVSGWRLMAREGHSDTPFAAFHENLVLMDAHQPWEPFVAHYSLHRALRLQRDIFVFHASSADVWGKGVLLVGPKKSGKTTLSMTLAARGHGFLGDEFAAIRRSTCELLPFRRAVSIRQGPAAPEVEQLWNRSANEVYPDGSTRVRARISQIFPESTKAGVTPLSTIFFLRDFREKCAVEAFKPTADHIKFLTPQGSTLWSRSPAQTMMGLAKIMNSAKCYFLDLGGSPVETARLVEKTLEAM